MRRLLGPLSLSLSLAALSACDDRPPPLPKPPVPADETRREIGATGFVSADPGQSGSRNTGDDAAPGAGAVDEETGDGASEDRTVEEGDIYRVIAPGLVANLNAYRGLQLLDLTNPADPRIVGRAQISGYPVELYVHDDVAYVLRNDWSGYYGSRFSSQIEARNGGVIAAIDVSDRAHPTILQEAFVPGYISTSRMTTGGDDAALYVASSEYVYDDVEGYATHAIVRSFDVSAGTLVEAGAVDLGGWVADIHATTDALLVARTDWTTNEYRSRVSLVDISDPRGALVLGDEVAVSGVVASQFNMDLRGGILRVVSGASWSGTQTNHVETFDAHDLADVVPVDHATFGDGEQLYATLFLQDKAFFVTYLRVDPFHAFDVAADGTLTERNEYTVAGWNDFLRATFDGARLIGIGTNDDQGRTMSVSLYDSADTGNAQPLIARADVDVDASWSEASWDHRAFSVVEGAVSLPSADGSATETGLVLLPYMGWDQGAQTYTTAVQIFTFSPTTLTKRGSMEHGTPVRRSFLAADALTANLSDAALSLFDTTNPAAPIAKGKLELAPSWVDVLPLPQGFQARVKGRAEDYWYWWGASAELPNNVVEILRGEDDPDTATAIASIEVPADAQVYVAGDALVSVRTRYTDTTQWPYETESDVAVFDVSDPEVPVAASSFTTDRLPAAYYGYYPYYGGMMEDCWACGGWWYGTSQDVHAVPGGLAFLSRHPEQESLGIVESCSTYPVDYASECVAGEDGASTCTYTTGGRYCTRPIDAEEAVCSGSFQSCSYTYDGDGNYTDYACVDLDEEDVQTQTSCSEYEQFRYWTRFVVDVLDVRDPANAALAPELELPHADQGMAARADGSRLWVSFTRPEDVVGSTQAYVRWFARPIDLSNPAQPVAGEAINVPGELVAVDGAAATTRDWLWSDSSVEVAVNQVALDLDDATATLIATKRFEDEWVYDVKLDGAGHVLVNHRSTAWAQGDMNQLAVLDGALQTLSDVDVDSWATLKDGAAGRALFQVPGGLLVMNLADPSAPFPQAYFPLRGWPTSIRVDDERLTVPAGRYGVYRFDLDTVNLLAE
jgi:hypothetical protein